MKIEKVNDHQIRCTLTKEDLASREIKISELAYGTEKAKALFRDMMQQAALKYGFEAEDIPLMIEAIPLNPDCIVLIITKVEDPEEIDTRFSKFAPSVHEESDDEEEDAEAFALPEGTVSAGNVLDLFKKIKEDLGEMQKRIAEENSKSAGSEIEMITGEDVIRTYLFNDLDTLISISRILNSGTLGFNTLYKDNAKNQYTLLISSHGLEPADFNRICNVLSEYATAGGYSPAMEAYFKEHCDTMLASTALQCLATL